MFLRHTWPALLWAVIVMVLCGLPGEQIPELTFLEWLRPDKIVHLILFGVQSYLLCLGLKRQSSYPSLASNAILLALMLSIVYGALIEFLQDTIFIHRNGDVRDAIANAIGAVLGVWLYRRRASKGLIN